MAAAPSVLCTLAIKRLPVVGKADHFITPLNVNIQVWSISCGTGLKTYRNRVKVLSCAKQTRPDVDLRFCGVPPWYLNDQNLPVEIDRDEVARVTWAIVVADNRVYLKRAWPAIMPVVLLHTPPA